MFIGYGNMCMSADKGQHARRRLQKRQLPASVIPCGMKRIVAAKRNEERGTAWIVRKLRNVSRSKLMNILLDFGVALVLAHGVVIAPALAHNAVLDIIF
jgi:hypothetical protein